MYMGQIAIHLFLRASALDDVLLFFFIYRRFSIVRPLGSLLTLEDLRDWTLERYQYQAKIATNDILFFIVETFYLVKYYIIE